MRIVSVEIIETKIPLKHPYRLSKRYGDVAYTHPTVVKVTTDNGLFGWGETDAWVGFTSESPESVAVVLKNNIAPSVLGEEATNVLKIHDTMNFFMRENHMAKMRREPAIIQSMSQSPLSAKAYAEALHGQ
jgi:L-alanine-DL-glutamate epimerase-like enolase superfamily enzyme